MKGLITPSLKLRHVNRGVRQDKTLVKGLHRERERERDDTRMTA